MLPLLFPPADIAMIPELARTLGNAEGYSRSIVLLLSTLTRWFLDRIDQAT